MSVPMDPLSVESQTIANLRHAHRPNGAQQKNQKMVLHVQVNMDMQSGKTVTTIMLI